MDEIKKDHLSEEQRAVTQEGVTEKPFAGKYDKTDKKGMYVCVVCGEPLFNSDTKFDSGSGWPSFFQPIHGEAVGEKQDASGGMVRTEVHCKKCHAHLGHVFQDAPEMPTGKRYCVNSASLTLKEDE